MKFLVFVFSLLIFTSHASDLNGTYSIEKSKLTYHINFMMKHVVGTSEQAKGKVVCEKKECEFLIAASIKSFTSPDSNRDSNMLDTMKALEFPMVVVRSSTDSKFDKVKKMDLKVKMSGKEVTYKGVEFNIEESKTGISGKGKVTFKMSDFGLERPSLMMVEIDDEIPVDIDVTWKKI